MDKLLLLEDTKVLDFYEVHNGTKDQVNLDSEQQLHLGFFKTVEDAFCAYKSAKEAYIKELAQKYITRIDVRAYNALMNYKVEITD